MFGGRKPKKLTDAQVRAIEDLVAGHRYWMADGTIRALLRAGLIVESSSSPERSWLGEEYGWSPFYVVTPAAKAFVKKKEVR